MISKIAPTATALLMISSVNAFMYNKNFIDTYTIAHEPETIGCAQCITAGYEYLYAEDNEATFSYEYIESGGSMASTITIDGDSHDVNFCTHLAADNYDTDVLRSG
jgi:hypothetical protein